MAQSSNVFIHGSTFNSAQGDFHIHNRDSESGLHYLKLGVSLGATHDAAERFPPPNCHPDTRKAVRQIILDWIHDESSSSFLWLYGPAGAGKTAILQAIAEFLCSPSGSGQHFGGSFFFSRGKQGRDQGHFLFSTIAYQLSLKVPGLRQHVNRIMELDPTLHTKSMDVQLQTLIVDVFQYLSPPPQHSYLVIVDGLDECYDKATQQLILRLLCETVTVNKLPLRFLIGSRPESHIRASFDRESLYTVTRRVVLDETFEPGKDIRVFLQDGFAKICAENSILSHVEQPWPGEGIIDLLVQRSSGQFIYATTVLKFVGADFCSPTKQLALVLKPDPTAFSDLDHLYTEILSVYPSTVNIVQVLGTIIACEGNNSPEVIEDILEMEEGELKLVLRGLSSLMYENRRQLLNNGLSSSYVIPHFAHASFRDYLFNSSRSGLFHVSQQEYENQVTIRSFALILQSILSWRGSSITRVLHTATWDYFRFGLSDRFCRSPTVVQEAIMTDINDLMQKFWRNSNDGLVGSPFFAIRRLFKILEPCSVNLKVSGTPDNRGSYYPDKWKLNDDGSKTKFKFMILFDGYRKMFDQSISKSKEVHDLLRFLPGVVVQKDMSMQGMADLYRIKQDLLEPLIKSELLRPSRNPFAPGSHYRRYLLSRYLSGFLLDRDRSQLYYCDPMLQHISICRHFLSLLRRSNDFGFQSPPELSDYVYLHFYDHLCGAMGFFHAKNIPVEQPAILHDLETTAYYVDKHSSGYILARRIIYAILRWANMLPVNCHLKGVAISVSNVDLMERVCHLTNKIYRELLCITKPESMPDRIEVSWEFLTWISVEGRIPRSFTNFITIPELSGRLYISPDIYHTEITEYSLQTIYQNNLDGSLNPVWNFKEHLCDALPTEKIFHLLRSIRSDYLSDDSPESMLDVLEIINTWLQGLGSKRPSDLYDRFQGELLRHKKPLPQFDF